MNTLQERRLSLAMIESSSQIRAWLDQFQGIERDVAIDLLLHLRFVTRDGFSEWVRNTISGVPSDEIALYAVRKFQGNRLWDDSGTIVSRPGTALGSEDFVYSLISQLSRESKRWFDNPDLNILKKHCIRNVILLDDSVGSGDRLLSFAKCMFNHKTFLSWWSYGLVSFHVISYARTREGGKKILCGIPGSDHPKRKYPKSHKIEFHSKIVYSTKHLMTRWGNRFNAIWNLCDGKTQIPKRYRKGYGKVMSNIVFYHSIPNNIPGVLFWSDRQRSWHLLFPARTIPDWTVKLLESKPRLEQENLSSEAKRTLCQLIGMIKKGIRRPLSLALRMDMDVYHVNELIDTATSLGLITGNRRLTKVGLDFIKRNESRNITQEKYDYSLYIPGSWCASQGTIQPSPSGFINPGKTDSAAVMSADGEVGKASLARTDATAATPPVTPDATASVNVVSQRPSKPRKGHDIHGPKGLKEE